MEAEMVAQELRTLAKDYLRLGYGRVRVGPAEMTTLLDDRDRLKARVEELEAALQPFSREADANPLQSDLAPFGEHVTYGDLRRARHMVRPSPKVEAHE